MEQVNYFEKFDEFFGLYKGETYGKLIEGKKSLIVDFSKILEFDIELSEYILDFPEEAIKIAEESLNAIGKELFVRFKNLPKTQEIKIKDIRSKDLNKLIYFEGTIRQSSDIRPKLTNAKFNCECGTTISIEQKTDKFIKPTICSCGNNKYFKLTEKNFTDIQKIVVEESAEDLDSGSQPKRISVLLDNDLVEPKEMKKTIPGNKVRIIGFVNEIEKKSQFGGVSNIYDIQCKASYIEPIQEDFSDIVITEDDIKEIINFSKRKDLYQVLTNSIAPSILGLEKVKGALLIQLFGGVKKVLRDKTLFREMIHILIIGDPGTSKSKLATYISKAAPKARYLAGKGASAVGLTATVLRDEFTKGYILEAGALVLTNNGILVLDELDKMSEEDTSALHEALEQGTISVAKANVQAKLNSRTSLLACANPKFGRFDIYKSIAEQIDMPPALINRFDLIFALKDLPNKEKDKAIAKHILSFEKEFKDEISQEFIRKYIAYAKQKVEPKMTEEAEKVIMKFYVDLRNSRSSETGPIPISPRQLEALIRLSQGSARIRLSDIISKADANRAIELLTYSLSQVGIDPDTGELDIDIIQTGMASSKREKLKLILDTVGKLSKKSKEVNVEYLISELKTKIDTKEIDEILIQLNKEGHLYIPKNGFISLV